MSNPTPRFTGIFIPVEILTLEEISPLEQLLISWIDALHDKERGGCYASNTYLSQRLRVQENTIAKAITHLRQIGLIEDVSFDGRVRIIRAKISEYILKCQSKSALDLNPSQCWRKIQVSVGEKSNPTYIENKVLEERSIPKSKEPSKEAIELSSFLQKKILENKPDFKFQSKIETWAYVFDLMIRIDKRTPQSIKNAIEFAQSDSFWMSKVLSPDKLRKQMDQLEMQISANQKKSAPKQSNYDKVKSRFVSGEQYNGYYVFYDEFAIMFQTSTGYEKAKIKFSEQGFDDQLRTILEKLNIRI